MEDKLHDIKLAIWHHRKVNKNPVNLQVYADKAGVRLPICTTENAEALLKLLNKGKRKSVPISKEAYQRYRDAKYNYQSIENPNWIAAGHFIEPERPKIASANDLQNFIVNHATWMGCHANRINTTGRKVGGKWITGTTKKGTSDLALIICGRAISLEVKFGRDQPSEHQLLQQEKVRKAGGVYEFIRTVEEYFAVFDRYYSKVLTIFD